MDPRARATARGTRSPTPCWRPRCSGAEQNATDAEREGVRVKGLRLLETRLGERASGSITGLDPRGFFVELDDIPVDGFVRVSDDVDDRFDLDAAGVRLVGRQDAPPVHAGRSGAR